MINRFSKIRYIIPVFILALLYCSCDDNSKGSEEEGSSRALLLNLDAVSGNDSAVSGISNNTDVYVFNALEPRAGYFHHKVLNVERTPGYMKMNIPAGTWNFVLVGCLEGDIRDRLVSPNAAAERSQLPMWRTAPNGDGTLPDAPEIRMALIDGLSISANTDQTASALLERNVAKVRVVLEDGVGFATGSDNTVSLKDVPTSLSWDGSLYPDKDNPEVGSMSGKPITFTASISQSGHVISDTVDFIIPAHRSKSMTDVSTHKMKLAVNFKTLSDTPFSKTVEVQTAPKCNQIVELHLKAKGSIEIEVKVAPWETVSSTYNPELFSFTSETNTGTLASYTMEMKQERNWWVTLDDTDNFEFVDGTSAFGQFTASPVTIQVRRKAGGASTALSTKLKLYISGFGLYGEYDVTNLALQ